MKALICIKINLDPVEFIYVYKRKGGKKINKIDEIEEREKKGERKRKTETYGEERENASPILYFGFRYSSFERRDTRSIFTFV